MPSKKKQPEVSPPSPAPDAAPAWQIALEAAESKKAVDPVVLDLREVSGFTDYFLICSGANSRQIQAIADEIELQLKHLGRSPMGIEGYEHAEWILADYGDVIVHIFSAAARAYYDLDRLWRHGRAVAPRGVSNPTPAHQVNE